MKPLHLFTVVVLTVSLSYTTVCTAGEFDYLPERPGTFTATVSGSNRAVAKADAAAYKRNFGRLRELLTRQSVFKAPVGVDIKGYFRPNDEQPKSNRVPITGFGYLRFHFLFRDSKTGQPTYFGYPTDEMFVSVNDPDKVLEPCTIPGSAIKVFCEPVRKGELSGFPIYRGRGEVIVLSRTKIPIWVPLTREEFLQGWLAHWQKEAAGSPAMDTITPQILKNHQAALSAMAPEERRMQAREFAWDPFQPYLAPVGSSEGRSLVKVNPVWFDPKLPRSAFQLISVTFSEYGRIDPDTGKPDISGSIAPYRVWQALYESDWGEISGALTDK